MTATHALNSGALNVVPFPGAEEGASIIELQGTIEVTASLAGINLRLTTGASATPKAATSVTTKLNIGVQATTAPSAAVRDLPYVVKTPIGASAAAAATGSAQYVVKHLVGATAPANASGAATSFQLAKKSATAAAAAIVSVNAIKYAYRSASTTASALASSIGPLAKVGLPATTISKASAIAAMAIKTRPSASAIASAVGTVNSIKYVYNAALGVPAGNATAGVGLKFLLQAPGSAQAAGMVPPAMKMVTSANVGASAATTAQSFLKLTVGARTTATAIDYAVGADFASKLPAPIERQIVVPFYDRTMKVVA